MEHDEIDQLNILQVRCTGHRPPAPLHPSPHPSSPPQASMAAMSRAVRRLLDDHPHISPEDCVVLVDGNR